jgi:hypothetical protein
VHRCEFVKVYQSQDFIKYCKAMTPDYRDLMNEVATIIYSLPEPNYNNIVEGGYLLRYSQRCAFYYVNNKFNTAEKKDKLKLKIIPIEDIEVAQSEDERLVNDTIVKNIIERDMRSTDINIYIASRMFMYSIKHGSVSAYAQSSGITRPTVTKYVQQYKKRVIKCYRKESQL